MQLKKDPKYSKIKEKEVSLKIFNKEIVRLNN